MNYQLVWYYISHQFFINLQKSIKMKNIQITKVVEKVVTVLYFILIVAVFAAGMSLTSCARVQDTTVLTVYTNEDIYYVDTDAYKITSELGKNLQYYSFEDLALALETLTSRDINGDDYGYVEVKETHPVYGDSWWVYQGVVVPYPGEIMVYFKTDSNQEYNEKNRVWANPIEGSPHWFKAKIDCKNI